MSICTSILYKISDFVSFLFGVVASTGGNGQNPLEYDLFPRSFFASIKPEGDVKQCSTNHNFILSEEHFIPSPVSEKSPHEKGALNQIILNDATDFISLSPVSSVKSNNSVNGCGQASSLSTVSTVSNDEEELDSDNETKVHECEFCDAKFRIRGYLTRHMKKHSSKKAYHCPFHDSNSSNKCHATGGFSRRDTFKTHLKARHFKYPPGIKSSNRTGMVGWCGICGEKFINNEIWVERHIEGGKCPGLPKSYLDRLNPGKKKTGKHSKFLDVQNTDQSLQLSTESKDVLTKLVSPSATNTPSPNVSSSFGGFDYAQTSQQQSQQQVNLQNQYIPSPLPTITAGMMNYNTNYQSPYVQQQQQQQQQQVQYQYQDAQKADIDMLVKRKIMLEQYIETLQKAAQTQQRIDFNSNCFRAENNGSQEAQDNGEDYPSLDSEYSSGIIPANVSMGYPVNVSYGVSLEEN